jgi:hypothetical protein
MDGTKDGQRWRSHVGAKVSSGGGEAWRSQWRRRCGQVGGADPCPEAAVEPECHLRRYPCPEAPRLKAVTAGACCNLTPRIRDGGGDPQVVVARVGLGEGEAARVVEGGRGGAGGIDLETLHRPRGGIDLKTSGGAAERRCSDGAATSRWVGGEASVFGADEREWGARRGRI